MTREGFFSQPNSFLAIILQLPIPKTRVSSIPLFPSSYPGRLASRNSTLFNSNLLYNSFARTTQKTQPLYCWEDMRRAPLHRNGSYSIVAYVLISAGICLPSSCLEMDVCSDFTILVFGRHVTPRTIHGDIPTCNFRDMFTTEQLRGVDPSHL
jgi:hypothetical protein